MHLPFKGKNVDDDGGKNCCGQCQGTGFSVLLMVVEEVGESETAAEADEVGGEGD